MGKSRRVETESIGLDQPVEQDVADGFGLDDPGKAVQESKPADNSRPYCPRHNCLMIAQTSRNVATIYKCRVKECDAVEVRMRPENPAPTSPMWCPLCAKASGLEIACEVHRQRSTPTELLMQCPQCRWEVRVARPTAAKVVARIRHQSLAGNVMAASARPSF